LTHPDPHTTTGVPDACGEPASPAGRLRRYQEPPGRRPSVTVHESRFDTHLDVEPGATAIAAFTVAWAGVGVSNAVTALTLAVEWQSRWSDSTEGVVSDPPGAMRVLYYVITTRMGRGAGARRATLRGSARGPKHHFVQVVRLGIF
jgi:hypothetical protein